MRWVPIASLVGIGAILGAVLAIVSHEWNRATGRALARLDSGLPAPAADWRYSPEQLRDLPPPVERYFAFALVPGQTIVRRAQLAQTGTFALNGKWTPFTATETFSLHPPGFVWDAKIRVAPLLTVRVRDSYVGGVGAMRGALAGLIPVVDQHDTPEMASSTLARYLAEAVWWPTALLPQSGVRWEAIDDWSARASMTDGSVTVSMVVRFGRQGEIISVGGRRYRDEGGTPVLTPFEGRFEKYERLDGMMVPTESEIGWFLKDGWTPYWRGRTVNAQFVR
jgi:hypothetical protein